MPTPTTDKQVRAYADLRALEVRAHALEELIGVLKRRCLCGGPGAAAAIQAATVELRTAVAQLAEQASWLESVLDFAGPVPAPSQLAEPRPLPVMRGTTDVLSVADVFGLLSSVRKTGTLTLASPGQMFVFEFRDGAIVHAATNAIDPGLRLGSILVAQNKLTEDQLRQHLAASASARQLLGTQLVRSQTVSVRDLRSALEVQVRRIFEAAFGLQGATFTFLEGNLGDAAERVTLSTMHLLLEAARQQDERCRRDPAPAAPAKKAALDSILPG